MNDTFSLLQKYTGISKYSKSEVITPQWVVSDMVDLLPQEIFNPDATFFDPAVKSGRFLIEIYNRLMASGLMKQAFPNEQDRHKHIIEKQLFGFATSPTAATVVRKTLYDNPLSTGNIRFTSDKLTKERVQGAFNNMKFDVVIGNPLYNKGMDIDFINMGYNLSEKYCAMIVPAKWQTAEADRRIMSSMTYGEFRKQLVPCMKDIVFYIDTQDIFDIQLPSGITYFLMEKEPQNTVNITNIFGKNKKLNSMEVRKIGCTLSNLGNALISYISAQPLFLSMPLSNNKQYVCKVCTLLSNKRIWDTKGKTVYNCQTQVCKKDDVGEYLNIASFDTKEEAESCKSWLELKANRFLMLLGDNEGVTHNSYRFVPAPPNRKFDRLFTDNDFYDYFKIPPSYIDIIEDVIKGRK